MTKENIMVVGIILAITLGLFGLVGGNNQSDQMLSVLKSIESKLELQLGAGTRFPNGISADTTSPSGAGNIRGTTFTLTGAATLGGDVTVTTTNTATSTIIVGCIQTYATSTDTAINMQFHASSSLADSTNGGSEGLVVWLYGSCPI